MTDINTLQFNRPDPAGKKYRVATLYILMVLTGSFFILGMSQIFVLMNKMVNIHSPLVDATMEVRLESTSAHLWLEEVISGDTTIKPENIWQHFDRADWYLKAMLEGAKGPEGVFLPLQSPELLKQVNDVKSQLKRLRVLAEKRFAKPKKSGIGSSTDNKYDKAFNILNKEIDQVETAIQKKISAERIHFRDTAIVLAVIAIALTFIVSLIIHKFISDLTEQKMQLYDATQSLLASNQQLEASEQQLKASNQQLEASEQQLKASNQQLEASEQQLKASNQQLYANEQELKTINRKQKYLLEELENKNNELQNIVYIASHDLRSPLVNIKGFSTELETSVVNLLKESSASDETSVGKINDEIKESLNFIKNSANSMEMLITGLLKISRLGSATLNFERVDTSSVVKEVVDDFSFVISKLNGSVDIESLPECICDRSQISQVFSNLISNALNYRKPNERPEITIFGKEDGNMTTFGVRDNGIGIDPQHQKYIFEIFHRLEPTGDVQGDGLGLALVTRILSKHHGYIWVESEPEKGSTFYFSIPKNKIM